MATRCPKCETIWPDGEGFCGQCGARLELAVAAESQEEETHEPAEHARAAALWFLELLPGLLSPAVLIASLGGLLVALVVLWFALFVLAMGAVLTAFAIGGAAVLLYWTSLGWLLYGALCSPVEALSEFKNRHWWAFIMANALPALLILWLLPKGPGP